MIIGLALPSRAKVGLLLVVSLTVLGLRFSWMDGRSAEWFQANLGYSFVLTLLVFWIHFFAKVAVARGWLRFVYWRPHFGAVVAILAITAFLHLHEPHVMRVVYDEPTHSLGALVMHIDKQAMMAAQSNYLGDAFVLSQHYSSFRQYLFQLVISLLHDTTGYRVANVFVLNFLLTPLVLLVAYFGGVNLAGRLAGGVAVGLLATLPLLAQNVTSGGYDVLNMVLVGALILSTVVYFQSPASERPLHMNLSLAFALLLGAARSESILYLIPWAAVVAAVWWRERQIELTGFAVLSPLFVLPNLISNLILVSQDRKIDAHMRQDGQAFFDIGNLPEHLSKAIFYFFNHSLDSTASILLSYIGIIGFVAYTVSVVRPAIIRRASSVHVIVLLFSFSVTLIYLFILTNYWGSPTEAAASRFCLPLMLIWALVGGWFVVQFETLKRHSGVVLGFLGLWCVVAAAPAMSRATATYSILNGRAEDWFIRYAEGQDRKRTLFVSPSPVGLIARRYAASGLPYITLVPSVFVRALKADLYQNVIVFEVWLRDPNTQQWRPPPGRVSGHNLVLETIDEREISPSYRARISRLVGYRKVDGTVVTTESDDPDVALKETFASEAERSAYLLSLYP